MALVGEKAVRRPAVVRLIPFPATGRDQGGTRGGLIRPVRGEDGEVLVVIGSPKEVPDPCHRTVTEGW